MKARPLTKTRFPQLLAVSAAVLLDGCSMIPSYERPAAPVAASCPAYATAAPGSPVGPTLAAASREEVVGALLASSGAKAGEIEPAELDAARSLSASKYSRREWTFRLP